MLIGLTGKAGSGKDSAYEFIAEWAESEGRPVRRDAFADRLKVSAARAIGFDGTPEECIDWCNQLKQPGWEISVWDPVGLAELPISGRSYLQRYGTEAHREVFGQDFWIDAVLGRYVSNELLVITDARFDNEAEAIRDAGGTVWEIRRPTLNGNDHHPSEQPVDLNLVDAIIVNDASLDDLRDCVLNLLTRVTA